jgi:alpha-L-fucosidase 2
MKRRDFIKTSALAAGLAGSLESLPSPAASGGIPGPTEAAAEADNRPAEYLRKGQTERFLPKAPALGRPYPISPMPLAERIKRKVVPTRGFCSVAPGELVSESLISGNGAMNIEVMGDPYSEQVLFHHESLLMPWARPLEAPKIADLFPQVRKW